MRTFILAAAALSASIAAVPAAAQSWRLQPTVQRQIQRDINQLENQITRAQQRRTISRQEAGGLRRQAVSLQRTYNRYSRNGLNRVEVTELERGINRLHQRLRLERRDWDGRRG